MNQGVHSQRVMCGSEESYGQLIESIQDKNCISLLRNYVCTT